MFAALAARQRVQLDRAGSLVNDVLLAVSCREAGTVLVTEHGRDFVAIQRHLRGFRFVAPDEVM